jgi:hypothetical protein
MTLTATQPTKLVCRVPVGTNNQVIGSISNTLSNPTIPTAIAIPVNQLQSQIPTTATCRGCNKSFLRMPSTNSNMAQYYRCSNCLFSNPKTILSNCVIA